MMKLARALTSTAVALLLATTASAQTTFIPNESAYGTPGGTIFWGAVGASGTSPTNSFDVAVGGIAGLSATVSQAVQSNFWRVDQGNGWDGNFQAGDELLWTDGDNGPMSFLFSSAIYGFGTQIQTNYQGVFLARILAFDAGNNFLVGYDVNGESNTNADNSAIFIGISSTTGIGRIELYAQNPSDGGQDFAINDVYVNQAAVPEPATLTLLATGLAGIGAARRRRKAASKA